MRHHSGRTAAVRAGYHVSCGRLAQAAPPAARGAAGGGRCRWERGGLSGHISIPRNCRQPPGGRMCGSVSASSATSANGSEFPARSRRQGRGVRRSAVGCRRVLVAKTELSHTYTQHFQRNGRPSITRIKGTLAARPPAAAASTSKIVYTLYPTTRCRLGLTRAVRVPDGPALDGARAAGSGLPRPRRVTLHGWTV